MVNHYETYIKPPLGPLGIISCLIIPGTKQANLRSVVLLMIGWAVPQGSPCHQIGGVLANTGRAASRGPSNVPWVDGMG